MGSYYGAGTKPPMLIGQQDLGVKIKPYLTYDDPGGGNDTASNASDEDILSDYINQMYTRFAPQEVAYDTRDEAEIRSSVAEWLRPSYDQAIANRQEQTRANKDLVHECCNRVLVALVRILAGRHHQQDVIGVTPVVGGPHVFQHCRIELLQVPVCEHQR